MTEEIPWNKICGDIKQLYLIRTKGKKEILTLKAINTVTGCFKIMQYTDKRAIKYQT